MLQKSPVDQIADRRRRPQEEKRPRLSDADKDVVFGLMWGAVVGIIEGVIAALFVERIELFWSLAWIVAWAILGGGGYIYYLCRRR
jgi:hypothetical protein